MKKFGYRKSRNGCQRCKKRRVKCDENQPCTACQKHGVPCSLEDAALVHRPGNAPKQVPIRSVFSPLLASDPGTPTDDGFSQEVALMDLELMNHYTARAYCEFPNVSESRYDFFQREIPRLGLQHNYLLHQCLAVAAFHLIHLSETPLSPLYLQRATYHVDRSLRGIREALQGEMTEEGAIALFMATSFLMPTEFASRRFKNGTEGENDDPLRDMQRLVGLFRGIRVVVMTAAATVGMEMVPRIFGTVFSGPAEQHPEWVAEYIKGLEGLESYVGMRFDLNAADRSVAIDGARVLINTVIPDEEDFRRLRVLNPAQIRIVYIFPFRAQDDFLELLGSRFPPVMTAFLYYCAAMYLSEPKSWFLSGWAFKQAKSIEQELRGTPWLEHARWPMEILQIVY